MYEDLTREGLLKILEARDETLRLQSHHYETALADSSLGIASFIPIYQGTFIADFKLTFHNQAFAEIIGGEESTKLSAARLSSLFDEDWMYILFKAMNNDGELPKRVTSRYTRLTYETIFKVTDNQLSISFRALEGVLPLPEQRQLSTDEERYRLIADNTTDFMYEVNMSQGAESGIGWLGGDFKRVTGYSPEEVKAKPELWEQLIHSEDKPFVMAQVAMDIEQGISGIYSYRITTKEGDTRWLEDRVTVRDKEGEKRILGAVRDVTEGREMKDAFEKERERYMALFNTSRRGILIVDMQNKQALDFNPRVLELFDTIPEEIAEGNTLKFSPEYQPNGKRSDLELSQLFKPHIEEGKAINFEWTFKLLSGKEFVADVSFSSIMLGSKNVSVMFVDDITPRKQAEEERRLTEERFEWLAESMDGVFSLIDETGLVYVTKRVPGTWEDLFARISSTDEMLNVIHPDDVPVFLEELKHIFTKDANIQYRILLPEKEVKERWIWSKTFRINQLNGKRLVAVISTEITDIKNKENELIRARELALDSARLKSLFIASMSHEIRTPMNGIIGFTEMLVDDNIPSKEKEQFPHIINDNCQRLLSVLNGILDISKIEAKEVQVNINDVDVNAVLSEQYQLFEVRAIKNGIKLFLNDLLPEANQFIRTDAPKLRQILNNLLSNALKFTNEGEVILGCKRKKDRLIFTVADTGIGIASDQQANVFKRFQQAQGVSISNYGGTGLGLSISDGLSDLLDGYIFVSSEIGFGTTFALNLPYIETVIEQKIKPAKIDYTKLDFEQRTILVAEDEQFNFMLLDKALSLTNAKVIRAETGQKVLDQLEAHPETELILMDMRMPKMDGMDATKIIKANPKYEHIPIIAQTAFGLNEDRDRILAIGCDAYISKPIDRKELYQLLQRYLIS